MQVHQHPFICLPDSVNFINNSSGGNTYKWYFGDGDSSFLYQPIHVYPDTGVYNVTLIVSDSSGCVPPDTGYTVVLAYRPKALTIDTVSVLCRGDSVQLNAYNGQSYKWTPSVLLSNDTISNPITFPNTTTTYKLVSEYYCNVDSVYLTVKVDTNNVTISPDTTICAGTSLLLTASGGVAYNWYPALGLANGTTSSPTVTPTISMYYYVDVTSSFGCTFTDSVYVDFHNDTMTISNDTSICVNQPLILSGTGGGSYVWSNSKTTSTITEVAQSSTTYVLNVVSPNGCLLKDSVSVTIFNAAHSVSPDTGICLGESATITAFGGGTYVWNNSKTTSTITETPALTTTYSVITTSPNGCIFTDTVEIYVNIDSVTVSPDTTICAGTSLLLTASGGVAYNWYPALGLANGTTSSPTVTPTISMYYYVDVTSSFGCTFTDSVYVDFHNDTMTISNDTSICVNQPLILSGTGGGSYVWSNSKTTSTITEVAQSSTTYVLNVVSPNGCLLKDSVSVTIFNAAHSVSPDTGICLGESATITAFGGGTYVWNNSKTTSTITETPALTTTYSVITTSPNGCIFTDTVEIYVNIDSVTVSPDTTICAGTSLLLTASGGVAYNWYPALGLANGTTSSPTVTPTISMYYYVDVTSSFGCTFTDSVYVDFHNDTMTISNDTSICVNQPLILSGTGGGSYVWSNSKTTSTITEVAQSSTTYVLNVVSPNGCLLKDSVSVTIFNAAHSVSPDTGICLGESATITAFGGGTYVWNNSKTTSTITETPALTTTYSVITTSPNGCIFTDTVEIYVNIDSVTVSPDTTICAGTSLLLTASGGVAYNWYPALGLANGTTSSPTVTPTISMYYYVDVTSSFGCTFTDSVYVDFHNDTMTISNDTSICVNQPLILSGTGGGSYVWSNSKTTSTITEVAQSSTTYVLNVVSPNGCLLKDSVSVTIFNAAHSVSPDTGICLGESATITAFGGGTYVWNNSKTTSTITETPALTTTYSVITTSPNGCIFTDTVEIYVNIDSVTVSPDTTICAGTSLLLTASGGVAYNWYPALGLANGTTSSPTVTPTISMYYYVDVTSSFGCTFTDSVYVDFHNDTMTISNDTSICVNQPLILSGTGGGSYVWSNSKTTSTITEVAQSSTTYVLNVVSPNGCLLKDSVSVTIFNDSITISLDTGICFGSSFNLFSTGGGSYNWDSNPTLVGNSVSNPIVTPLVTTNYKLTVVSVRGCVLKDSVTISLHNENYGVGPGSSICLGDTASISAYGGVTYFWSPSSTLTSPRSSQTNAFPSNTTIYNVSLITPKGCLKKHDVTVLVDTNKIYPTITNDTVLCSNSALLLSATGGASYSWSPAIYLSTPNSSSTLAAPVRNTTFYVDISNKCFTVRDSVAVIVPGNNAIVVPDKIICPGSMINIIASGAVQYQWKYDNSIVSGIYSFCLDCRTYEAYKI